MKQKHHIVQEKYLRQWNNNNQLNIYVITENRIIKKGANWSDFYRKNFNILNDKDDPYLPEKITANIDSEGIKVIKNIKFNVGLGNRGRDRSVLARYIVLQYIRTPRHREEINQGISAYFKKMIKQHISLSIISKETILSYKTKNKQELEELKSMEQLSENEIKQKLYEYLYSDDYKISLTNTGHSKSILKIDEYTKDIFESQFIFLFAPKDTSFITSNNPCFSISLNNRGTGLLSPNGIILFPLRPDICVMIKLKVKDKKEYFSRINKKEVREINLLILENSYSGVIAIDKKHLKSLVKNYNYKEHNKIRKVKTKSLDDYFMITFE